MFSQNLSPQKRGLKKFLAKKFVESAGIFFTLLLVFSAIVFAFTTWSPGGPPQAAPGEGNVELKEALWTKNGPAKIFYNGGDVGIGTMSPGAKLDVDGNAIADDPIADNHLATKAYVDAQGGGGGLTDCQVYVGEFAEASSVVCGDGRTLVVGGCSQTNDNHPIDNGWYCKWTGSRTTAYAWCCK